MIDNTMTKRTSKITFLSILTALAIMINILEFMVPPPIPVGGFKWGFSNFILLMTLYQFGIREAFIVGMLKVLVASFFSGRFLSPGFFMGLSGTFSSLLIMSLLFRGRFGMMVISVSGGLYQQHGTAFIGRFIICRLFQSLLSQCICHHSRNDNGNNQCNHVLWRNFMVEKDTYNLILASNSPRRRELMERFGMPFRSVSHKLEDESVEDMEKKHEQEIVVEIALNKLRSLYDDYQENGVVILSADTMVFFNGHALGKPKDEEEAFQMLKAMSGEWHEVYTGCAIFIRTPEGKEHEIKFWEKTRVKFRKVPKPFIRHYCEGGSPLDKAGFLWDSG